MDQHYFIRSRDLVDAVMNYTTGNALFLDNCTLIDARDPGAQPGMTVSISSGKIQDVGLANELRPTPDQQYIDLDGACLLPGLWDVHCHLGVYYPDPKAVSLFETEAERALRAHRHAQDALLLCKNWPHKTFYPL